MDKLCCVVYIGVQKKYPERQISNFIELNKIISVLDLDDGVRVLGNIPDLRGGGFIFISTVESITKINQKYCANIVERVFNEKANMYLPGEKEDFLYFKESKDVMKYIEINAIKPLRAWYY